MQGDYERKRAIPTDLLFHCGRCRYSVLICQTGGSWLKCSKWIGRRLGCKQKSSAPNGENILHALVDASMLSWVSNSSDPDEWLGTLQYSNWRNKAFDNLLQKSQQTIDTAKRTQL